MDIYLATPTGFQRDPQGSPALAMHWLDCTSHDLAQTDFLQALQNFEPLHIQELHLQDASNPLHPSHYDGTATYDCVVFRCLADPEIKPAGRKKSRFLQTIHTQPITFFITDHSLITVQHRHSKAFASVAGRIHKPCTPHELMLRFLNHLVDGYLALRQPLTDLLDRWQRELLDPRRNFSDWTAFLDARLELRKLEALAEEQIDALQELREAWNEPKALPYDAEEISHLRVRLSDVIEHIERVLRHAQRLEGSVESAIQLHFASAAHATSKTVNALTLMTAIFAPLTLLTGFYGMNVPLPWQTNPQATYWILMAMGCLSATLLVMFGGVRLWRNARYR